MHLLYCYNFYKNSISSVKSKKHLIYTYYVRFVIILSSCLSIFCYTHLQKISVPTGGASSAWALTTVKSDNIIIGVRKLTCYKVCS